MDSSKSLGRYLVDEVGGRLLDEREEFSRYGAVLENLLEGEISQTSTPFFRRARGWPMTIFRAWELPTGCRVLRRIAGVISCPSDCITCGPT